MPIGSAVVPGSSPRPGRGRCSEPRSAARYLGHGAAARRNRAGNRPGRTSAGEPRWASTGRLIASRSDALSRTDPHTLVTPEEAAEAGLIAERLARAIRYRLCRRRTPARRREMIDIRRTIRRNLSRGGEPIELRRKHRPERPVKLVVLLDASGSISIYSRYFLNFVRGLIGRWLHADAFLFHTRLVQIADALRERDPMSPWRGCR
jgi:uncharacterized protein with von Willebrand factor type A (vWA) domain